jgi:hypothetical protein
MDEETTPRKPNPFNIPIQYVNFVSFIGNDKEVIFQFGQHSTDDPADVLAIAKIGMTYDNAIAMLEYLNEIKKWRQDD